MSQKGTPQYPALINFREQKWRRTFRKRGGDGKGNQSIRSRHDADNWVKLLEQKVSEHGLARARIPELDCLSIPTYQLHDFKQGLPNLYLPAFSSINWVIIIHASGSFCTHHIHLKHVRFLGQHLTLSLNRSFIYSVYIIYTYLQYIFKY